jgi:hypothetical protein
LLWRARWLLLSTAALFVWMTPGISVSGLPGDVGVTTEGIHAAFDHVIRLAAFLAMVALLQHSLDDANLIAGLYVLMRPLKWLGVDRKKIAVRLMLTLRDVTTEKAPHWRSMFQAQDFTSEHVPVRLPAPPWGAVDLVAVIGVSGLFVCGWLWT